MRSRISFKGLVFASSLLVSVGLQQALAGGISWMKSRPTCPPYCQPLFGFFPTQWRPWPGAGEALPGPSPELVPAPAPAPEDAPKKGPTDEKKGEEKKGQTPSEKVSPAKPEASRNKPAAASPAVRFEERAIPSGAPSVQSLRGGARR